MADEEFKYPIDMNKIKNNKLYSKFVKNMEKDNTKPKEDLLSKPV
jgi:hypothetical protein